MSPKNKTYFHKRTQKPIRNISIKYNTNESEEYQKFGSVKIYPKAYTKWIRDFIKINAY